MSWSNQSKSSSTFSTGAKSSSSFTGVNKTIRPWKYNEAGYKYNQALDLEFGVYGISYNSIGEVTFTNQPKS